MLESKLVDRVHMFIAPKIVGSEQTPGNFRFIGVERMNLAIELRQLEVEQIEDNISINGIPVWRKLQSLKFNRIYFLFRGGSRMFTGLIEEIGRIRGIAHRGETMRLTIEASVVMNDLKLGDSVAVQGVCLTVTAFVERTNFTVDVMPQTYRDTNLRELQPGSKVNLERAMLAGGRFGGISYRDMWTGRVR